MSLAIPILKRYHLLHQISNEGTGTVYLAQDEHLPRQIALRIIRLDHDVQSQGKTQPLETLLLQKAQAVAQLDHEAIAPILDVSLEKAPTDSYLCVSMESYSAGSLANWLQENHKTHLLFSETARLLSRLAEALSFAHERNILHQNLKLSNIFLSSPSQQPGSLPDVLLADFALAPLYAAQSGQTMSQSAYLRTTYMYLAPEQWEGSSVRASDQYALAILAFRLLTGQFPFQGPLSQVIKQHLKAQPPAASSLAPDLHPAVDKVLRRALAKKPEERFPSVRDFARAFAALEYRAEGPQNVHAPLTPVAAPQNEPQQPVASSPSYLKMHMIPPQKDTNLPETPQTEDHPEPLETADASDQPMPQETPLPSASPEPDPFFQMLAPLLTGSLAEKSTPTAVVSDQASIQPTAYSIPEKKAPNTPLPPTTPPLSSSPEELALKKAPPAPTMPTLMLQGPESAPTVSDQATVYPLALSAPEQNISSTLLSPTTPTPLPPQEKLTLKKASVPQSASLTPEKSLSNTPLPFASTMPFPPQEKLVLKKAPPPAMPMPTPQSLASAPTWPGSTSFSRYGWVSKRRVALLAFLVLLLVVLIGGGAITLLNSHAQARQQSSSAQSTSLTSPSGTNYTQGTNNQGASGASTTTGRPKHTPNPHSPTTATGTSGHTPTPGASPTVTGVTPGTTPTAQPPTNTSAPVIPAGWRQVLNEAMTSSNADSSWEQDSGCTFHTGYYEMTSTGSNYCSRGDSSTSSTVYSSQFYSLDVSIQQGSQAGFIFRNGSDAYYYFSITTAGSYALEAHSGAGGGQDNIITSGTSSAIHQGNGQWNTLAVLARGGSFNLYINNVSVASASDSTYTQGIIGVAVNGPGPQNIFADARFKNVSVWIP